MPIQNHMTGVADLFLLSDLHNQCEHNFHPLIEFMKKTICSIIFILYTPLHTRSLTEMEWSKTAQAQYHCLTGFSAVLKLKFITAQHLT